MSISLTSYIVEGMDDPANLCPPIDYLDSSSAYAL